MLFSLLEIFFSFFVACGNHIGKASLLRSGYFCRQKGISSNKNLSTLTWTGRDWVRIWSCCSGGGGGNRSDSDNNVWRIQKYLICVFRNHLIVTVLAMYSLKVYQSIHQLLLAIVAVTTLMLLLLLLLLLVATNGRVVWFGLVLEGEPSKVWLWAVTPALQFTSPKFRHICFFCRAELQTSAFTCNMVGAPSNRTPTSHYETK